MRPSLLMLLALSLVAFPGCMTLRGQETKVIPASKTPTLVTAMCVTRCWDCILFFYCKQELGIVTEEIKTTP